MSEPVYIRVNVNEERWLIVDNNKGQFGPMEKGLAASRQYKEHDFKTQNDAIAYMARLTSGQDVGEITISHEE